MKNIEHQQTGEKLLPIMIFTLIISSMSVLVFTFVLPEISKEFNLTISQVGWLTISYTLIYAIGTVTYGKLTERFKIKDLLTFGFILFSIGSIIGVFSHSFWLALLGRCIQSMGASAIPATIMLIPVRYFTPERRGKAMGTVATGLALGTALGPVVSALIAGFANWRFLFALPLLILFTLPFYRKQLKTESKPTSGGKLDWLGGALLASFITLLLLAITLGEWIHLLIGIVVLLLFITHILSTDDPFIKPKLFKNKRFTIGISISFVMNGIVCSLYFMTPLFLAEIHQLPSSWIGLVMVPAAMTAATLGRKAGRFADQRGDASLFFIASGFLLIAFFLLSTFIGSSPILIATFLIFGNVGQSFMLIALSNTISKTMHPKEAGIGMGLMAMMNFLVQSIATGIYSKLIDIGATTHWNPMNISSSGFIFSNIFLTLAVFQVIMILFYYTQFNNPVRSTSKITK